MLNKQTFDKLYGLKLLGMAEGFKEQLQQPNLHGLSFEERFGLLVDRQWTFKEDCRLQRFLKEAKLKMNACAEDIDYKTPREIDKSVILSLLSGEWIQKHQNVIISGPTGVGKTFLAWPSPKKHAARVTGLFMSVSPNCSITSPFPRSMAATPRP